MEEDQRLEEILNIVSDAQVWQTAKGCANPCTRAESRFSLG